MKWSTVLMGWRNLGRNRKRTLLAIGAIALGQFTLVLVNGLMAGFFQDILDTVTGPMVGHIQIHQQDWREEWAVDLYIDNLSETCAALKALPEVVKVSPRIYTAALAASGEESEEPAEAEPGMISGVDITTERARGGLLQNLSDSEIPGSHEVILGQVLATRLGVKAGQLLAIIGQDVDGFPVSDLFTIKSVMDSNVEIIKTMGIVMSKEDAGEFLAMPDQAHEIVVYSHDFRQATTTKAVIASLPLLKGLEILTWREAVPEIVRMIDIKAWFDFIFLGIVFIAAAAGIANTAMMSTFERRREFGMLLAVGAPPRRIIGMVLVESVLLGLIGVAIGSVLGAVVVLITSYTGIDYSALGGGSSESIAYNNLNISMFVYPRFEVGHIVYGFIAVTLTSVLASLWPALLAAGLEPMEAMRT